MAGGTIQLVAYGAQDVYLTADPQITFFKIVYRRHTNFSIEVFEHALLDNPNFGSTNVFEVHRLGDLMTKMYLRIVVNGLTPNEGEKFAWIRRLGHALVRSVEVTIGGTCYDRHVGTWLDIWYELARSGDHDKGYLEMIGDVSEMTTLNGEEKPEYIMYIPLKFWFNRHYGLSLPIVAIQYHRIIFNIKFERIENLIVTSCDFDTELLNDLRFLEASLMIEYGYLDKVERARFATKGHDQLMEQVQHTGEESMERAMKRFQLHFDHPAKEIVWAMKNGNYTTGKKFLGYTHLDDWSKALIDISKQILLDSSIFAPSSVFEQDGYGNIIIISPAPPPSNEGIFEEFLPGTTSTSSNGKITVSNNSTENSFWLNTESLKIDLYNLVDKINANIFISEDEDIRIVINGNVNELTVRDVSIPVELFEDTRLTSNDVIVNQFSNYGVLIDGSINPVLYAKLDFNDQERFPKRNGKFFNYLQTEMHHNNTPKDGINVYSFAFQPEIHQPSGTSNLSRIERIIFTLWIGDGTQTGIREQTQTEPNLNLINLDNRLYIFVYSYNIIRIINGLAGLSYTD